MPRQRKRFAPEEKVSILRRHLLDKVPVSTVCEEAGIQPSLLYQWQKQLFENGPAAFQAFSRPKVDQAPAAHHGVGSQPPPQRRGPGRADGGTRRVKRKSWGTLTAGGGAVFRCWRWRVVLTVPHLA